MMRKLSIIVIITVLFFSVLVNISCAQSVSGKIFHNGRPAPHVLVIFYRGNAEVARAITGNDGYYFIRSLPPGTYRVTLSSRSGSRTSTVTVGSRGGRYNLSM
jgi:hypothetical protein